jgi:hypothetical protein
MTRLPPFPVDDFWLDQVEHALNTRIGGQDADGNRTLDGGEFTLSMLLNHLSGYDPTKVRPLDEDGRVVEYPGQVYHPHNVIRSYGAEIRRLRAEVRRLGGDDGGEPEPAAAAHPLTRAQEVLAKAMTEEALTESIRDRCTTLRLERWHTYNSRRSPAGWVDEVIAGPRGVLFRELKTETGKPTPAQGRCIELLFHAGLDVAVWRPSDLLSGRIDGELAALVGPRNG